MKSSVRKYDHKATEGKWQRLWAEHRLNQSDISGADKPYYNLMMFPYPSAEGLHVGNMYAFTGSDIFGRYKRLQGFDVFEPIGLDGFGIHSENYALKVGRHPMDHAAVTEKNFYAQLQKIGPMFDWSRTAETYDPGYYHWTQWLFVQMFKHGLAYRGKSMVNWCPGCKTVLADEQVINGVCERCGNTVEKRTLEQWFFKITAYSEKLLENLSNLDWSEKVKIAQQNWIGKKNGINITYAVEKDGKPVGEVTCFTVHPNTNYGATFVVLAPEHPFVSRIVEVIDKKEADQVSRYVKTSLQKTAEERAREGRKKTGVNTGLVCVNPLTGYRMPLFVSDFVLMDFGTGAVVGVPAHDERDYDFARVFGLENIQVVSYGDEVHVVVDKQHISQDIKSDAERLGGYFEERDHDYAIVTPQDAAERLISKIMTRLSDENGYVQIDGAVRGIIIKNGVLSNSKDIEAFLTGHGYTATDIWPLNLQAYPFCYTKPGTMVNSEQLNGLTSEAANSAIMDFLEKKGWGVRVTSYHLRDWLISRQRYWGPPIPMIYCAACARAGKSWFSTDEAEEYHSKSVSAKNVPAHPDNMEGWYPVPEPELPVKLPRIEDYRPGDDGVAPLAKHKEFYRTTCPGCGGEARRESDVSDTFLDSSWYFLRYPSVGSATESTEPFDPKITRKWLPVDMYTGGAEHSVLHLLYSRFVTMALKDFGYVSFEEPFIRFFAHGLVIKDGAKMSKSKGNVVNPDEYIEMYGSDALRLYLMFMGPFSQGGDFRDTAMEGMSRWVGRVWRMSRDSISKHREVSGAKVQKALQYAIKKVGDDIAQRHYNTAIAAMMEFTNLVADEGGIGTDDLAKFLVILSPFAPHMTEELWQELYSRDDAVFKPEYSVHTQHWPAFDADAIREETVTVVVQVNGKLRDRLTLPVGEAQDQTAVEKQVADRPAVTKHLAGLNVRKTVFVPGKLINFVAG